jgi:hypothetical protein
MFDAMRPCPTSRCEVRSSDRGFYLYDRGPMLCPNCMSPYVEPFEPEQDPPPDEQLLRCTECEYVAPRSEFVPENYR